MPAKGVTFIPATASAVNSSERLACSGRTNRLLFICCQVASNGPMGNPYQQTRFILGTPDARSLPPDTGLEVAFAGRSNAGKSSALNTITGQRALARISKAPGRTREINFFHVADDRRLVDLPGYGYAKVSKSMKGGWQKNIDRYLENRKSLCGVILLMDVRHPLKEHDQQVLAWCAAAGLPTHVLLTKADKLKRGPASAALLKTKKLLAAIHPAASIQLFSSHTRLGVDSVHQVLDTWLEIGSD